MVNRGFTLVELMVVVAILGVIAAIAYPTYQEHVRKTKRVDAQSEMIEISRKLSNFKAGNYTYRGANLASLQIPVQLPAIGTALYNLSFTPAASGVLTGDTWVMTAEPVAGELQAGTGHLVLNQRGEKCWEKGSDQPGRTPCTPTASTNWDGN
ncbi:prepilin-type N-terminal cleavage/methylation domain-containing protein [Acinetobacter cumulans]|uniref:Prepilin-type N-terminal cleavage/methylation domain-containing protein n=1 Tax=Acinetobacter cumulans TaxID=2136182 RepID=A0ABX9U9F3_9GAMM|nr:type IV pilin protein [Acinetobacter cumulans]RLL48597.1 prepilin-type N-terminal cleavage/methylation domain-containing protein [Acinetobacter cumulans]